MSKPRLSILPSIAVSDTRLSHSAFRTLAALCVHTDENGWCFPRLKTLGKLLGKSPQAVSKDIQNLEELGYLNIEARFEPGTKIRKSNRYQVRLDYPPQPDVETPSTSDVETFNDPSNDPSNDSEGKPSRRKSRDLRLDHLAIAGYREITRYYVPIAWRDDVIQAVGSDPAQIEKWLSLVKDWQGHGWRPDNVSGMLDAYRNGGVKNGNGKASYREQNQRLPKGV